MKGRVKGMGEGQSRERRPRFYITLIGLTLFASGFALTVYSLSSSDETGTSGGSIESPPSDSGAEARGSDLLTGLGLVIGMSGVIIATVGPAFAAFSRTRSI